MCVTFDIADADQDHHHGKNFAKQVGSAVTFGAGVTAGADAINSVIH